MHLAVGFHGRPHPLIGSSGDSAFRSTIWGLVFFAVHVLNALSHLGAAWLARRIGLVNTMVFYAFAV